MKRLASAVLAVWGLAAAAPAPVLGQAPAGPRILVMPFENISREGRIFWLGEASAVLLADDLNALGVEAITRDERRAAFERLEVPPAATLTDATVIRIGQLVGATQAVVGTLQLEADVLIVRARGIALDAGRIVADVTERGPLTDLFATVERVARRIAPPSPRTSEEVEGQHPPVAAFENYIKGLVAETPATAILYLNEALLVDPAFVRPRLALWDVYAEQGDYERALASVQRIPAGSSWSRRARFLAGLSHLHLNRNDDAFAVFQALADERSSAPVLNNLGVVQLRRAATPQTGRATYFFDRAAQADGRDSDYFFNLGYAYWLEHDSKAAVYWLREAVRRNPTDGDAHFVLGAALAASGNATGAAREKELAKRLSSTYEEWEQQPPGEQVPRGLERIKSGVELPTGAGVSDVLTAAGQRDQRDLTQFYLDRGRRLYAQENDREALSELNRALFLSPYEAEAHLLVGRIHLRGGRVQEAIDAFKISLWSAESAAGHAALAAAYLEGDEPDEARAEAGRALALDPSSVEAKQLLERLDP